MTAFFDSKDEVLCAIQKMPDATRHDALIKWEERLVYHVTLAAEAEGGLPDEIREQIHQCVLRHGVHTLPINAEDPDLESEEEYVRRLEELSDDLHSIFHRLAREHPEHSDDPRSVLKKIFTRGDALREQLISEGEEI